MKRKKYRQAEYGELEIKFDFDWDIVFNLKRNLIMARYSKKSKTWFCPDIQKNREILNDMGFEFVKPKKEIPNLKNQTSLIIPEKFQNLYNFQKDGVFWIDKCKGNALIADEMGLGKTIQALAYLEISQSFPVLIITPATLKLSWRNEIKKWKIEGYVYILNGKTPELPNFYPKKSIFIINYDIVSDWVDELKKLDIQLLIMDEAHYIQNRQAQRSKAIYELSKNIPKKIALTGTPILSKPVGLWSILRVVRKNLFPNFWEYVKRYCDAKQTRWGMDISGSSNTEELNDILRKYVMIRRKKLQVLQELPEKTRVFIPFEIDRTEYNLAYMDFKVWIEKEKERTGREFKFNALTWINTLKKLAVKAKMDGVKKWIVDFIDTGKKLVVFANFIDVINQIYDEFEKISVRIYGATSEKEREEAVKKFQTDEKVRLFVGNIKAAGVGITLTASSDVAFVEIPWTPGELVQAEDRIHRIGQTAQNITSYLLLADNTIEYNIAEIIDKKADTISQILDGEKLKEEDMLTALIYKIENEN